jgi:hypothetical protein
MFRHSAGQEQPKFLFRSQLLASFGFTERDDQYGLYGAIGTGLSIYGRLTYKNYLLRKYVAEPDPIMKKIIAGRFPFRSAELEGAQQYLLRYGKNPKAWLVFFPFSFIAYEAVKRGPRFWLWRQSSEK